MTISRREFLVAGSAASTLWLTGCGGGGPASGLNKTPAATSDNSSASCTATPVTGLTSDQIIFSQTVAFPNADIPLVYVPAADPNQLVMGTTNPISLPTEGLCQELLVNILQPLSSTQTCAADVVRVLRLHLSIPHDGSSYIRGEERDPISNVLTYHGDDFAYGASTNSPSAKVFWGDLIVTAPAADDGVNCWAYRIMSGSIHVVSFIPGVFASATLQLTNVIATAAFAGGGNNAAYEGGGQVTMNGQMSMGIFPLTTVIG